MAEQKECRGVWLATCRTIAASGDSSATPDKSLARRAARRCGSYLGKRLCYLLVTGRSLAAGGQSKPVYEPQFVSSGLWGQSSLRVSRGNRFHGPSGLNTRLEASARVIHSTQGHREDLKAGHSVRLRGPRSESCSPRPNSGCQTQTRHWPASFWDCATFLPPVNVNVSTI